MRRIIAYLRHFKVVAIALRSLACYHAGTNIKAALLSVCLLYTSDAADERSSVDLGGRRIIKKKNIVRI